MGYYQIFIAIPQQLQRLRQRGSAFLKLNDSLLSDKIFITDMRFHLNKN